MAAAAVLASCTTAPPIQPKGRVVVPINAKGFVAVTVPVLREVVVELPPIRQPGDQWVIIANDPRFLKPRQPIEPALNGKGFTASFIAIDDGHPAIRFFALRPGARVAVPSQTYEVRVQIE